MKKLLIDLLWWHLHSLGAFGRREQPPSAAREAGGLLPTYDGWFRECVRLFEQAGYLERRGECIAIGAAPVVQPDELWRRWDDETARWAANPDLAPGHALLEATVRALPDILTGRKAATEVLFPGSSLALVERAYKSNPMVALFSAVLAARLAAHVQRLAARAPGPGIRILEIGAGTGATSAVVLRTLAERGLAVSEYCYTDISRAFLNHAETAYGPSYPFLTFRTLNIELPIAAQGFDVAGYDVVVAANVLHATRSIRRTLRNTKALLRPHGLLLLNEMTGNNLFNHLTFGLLEGWWLYEDHALRLPGSPGLSVQTWRHVLEAERFVSIAFPCLGASELGELIVAESDGVVWLLDGEGSPVLDAAARPAAERVPRQPPAAAAEARVASGSAAPQPTGDRIGQAIIDELARSLRIARDRIRPDEPFATYGLDSILAVQVTRAINQALGVDLDITALFEHNTVDTLRGHIASTSGAIADAPTDAPTVEPAPATGDAAAVVERAATSVLARSLRIEPSRIRRDEPFASYGLDSILAVSVTRAINEELGIDLDITALFEHGTVAQLCDFIVASHEAQLRAARPAAPAVEPPAPRPRPAASPPAPRSTARPDAAHPGAARDAAQPEARDGAEGFAIIGMSGRFPGAEGVDELWQVIEQGRSCITAPPLDRPDWKAHADGSPDRPGGDEIARWWGGFIDGAHEFDPLFFGISLTEARQMSPEQRLMLMYAWNAVEDAGYAPRELAHRSTGVFIATGPSEYRPGPGPLGGAGEASLLSTPLASMIPNRISYAMNLHGPSECCETTCSSSLVALHRAIRSIQRGECEQAIVGGVNLILSPTGFASMEAVGMLSPSGKVRPFQDDADGTVRSEGVGAIVIKPLPRAIADGDFIHAVVKGTGVAHGGKGVSFTAPNIRGMKAAIQQAFAEAQIDPGTVAYVEAHGMSSTLADSAEIGALSSSLGAASPRPGDRSSAGSAGSAGSAYLGSLKPCLGHAEVFSGLAALMKTVMALRHATIPAIPGFGRLRGGVSLDGSRLQIATENLPWLVPVGAGGPLLPRRASINSFGIGGVNAHAVLEEYAAGAPRGVDAGAASAQIFVLSAFDEDRLRERARLLAARLERAPDLPLADIAYTLQAGREAMDCRLAVVTDTREALVAALEALLAGGSRDGHRIAFATAAQRNAELVELCATAAGEALVRSLVAEGKLDTIASYWVKGAPIDWSLLHGGQPRRRVPLPGYPFKRVSCWSQPAAPRATPPVDLPAPQAPSRDAALAPEAFITDLVASVLGLEAADIDRTRPLSVYGLNSLLLVAMVSHIRTVFPAFQPSWLRAHTTLDDIIASLQGVAGDGARARTAARRSRYPELLHLNTTTRGRPVFWVHGGLGSVETFQAIAGRSERPFYGIQARGFMTKQPPVEGIANMASHYIDILRTVQPEGPYDVGGFCLGGIVSYEMARQLQLAGEVVSTIVMIDSPDNTGFTNTSTGADFLVKNAALQLANTLLWPADEKDLSRVTHRLIHQDQIDSSLDDDAFVARVASTAAARGLAMPTEAVIEFIRRNLNVQAAYKLGEYVIRPLARADAVDCTYFRNRRGLFFGELAAYFQVAEDTFSLDHANYWQDWERELKRLRIIDIDAASHMTILHEDAALEIIGRACEELYRSSAPGLCVLPRAAGRGSLTR